MYGMYFDGNIFKGHFYIAMVDFSWKYWFLQDYQSYRYFVV